MQIIITNLEKLKLSNKKRRCRNCKEYEVVKDGLLINGGFYCGVDCVSQYGYKHRQKGADKIHKEKKAAFRQSDLKIRKAAAKKACHAYIRYRDKGKPCICCNRPLGEKYDAGHFLESGNNPLIRYDEDNIHAQSVYCNQYKGGDSDDYRGNLIKKIGIERVERLESMKGGAVKRTADDYLKIEQYYKQKLKDLKNES